ncbi:unnamed protein product, partial [Meganyctiphanes norvegica]
CLTSSNGHLPVEACGVKPYTLPMYARPMCNSTGVAETSIFFNLSLTTPTARSANPLLAGWYGGVNICLTPHFDNFSSNSLEVNCGPLSETNVVGNPASSQNHPNRTAKVL